MKLLDTMTKRDADTYSIDINKKKLFIAIEFDTAWSPPSVRFQKLLNKHKGITMELFSEEPGNDFEIVQ